MAARRLLILDDDRNVGRIIEFMAGSLGLAHRSVTVPDEFFEQLEAWEPTYILLDLLMPEMDGVQIIQRLAERNCNAAIVISSGVEDRIRDAALRAAAENNLHVAGSLAKPFTRAELGEVIAAVDATLSARRLQDEPRNDAPITEADLKRAVMGNQFELAYQPKVECATGVLLGFEALARWRHPEFGIINPDRFIPVAEANALIEPLTRQVVRQALSWMTAADDRADKLSLAVNISAKGLSSRGLADRLAAACDEFSFAPERLTLELTETAAMDDPALALGMLTRLRIKGFDLSIDDFGTGYSSMMQLSRLPFSEIKADKSFVMAASRSPQARAIVKATVDLGHSLGLRTVAEGVEDVETLDYLRTIGCDIAQGYYVARPMGAEEAASWAAGWRGWTSREQCGPTSLPQDAIPIDVRGGGSR
ncbi:MAG TPA: EAL domain-containing response regulator [Gammaproteobacteria bacterium]|nr:EAL domain-containing response regulator [Gammaproteobacteria bacterium]